MKHLNIRSSYPFYVESSETPVSVNTFVAIAKDYMQFLADKVLEEGQIMLPERLGQLIITGKKVKAVVEDGVIKGLAPDWKSTNELWIKDPEAKEKKQLVYHFNEDTNGIRYKFSWSKSRVLVANKTLYNLRMTRTNKRILSANVKAGKEYLIK